MDKFEYNAKLEEIDKLAEQGEYEEAAKIADTIEWKRVRNVRTLNKISEIYEATNQLEESKSVLLQAQSKSNTGRNILYRLTEISIKLKEFDEAVEYYTEFMNAAPNDNSKYVLKYKLYKERGSSLEEQIGILEEYKQKEYTERWAFELAKLYHEVEMPEKCVEECDDLALWFHNGKYVVKALELKKIYTELTPEQQTVYENPSDIVDMQTKEETVEKAVPKLEQEIMKDMPNTHQEAVADIIFDEAQQEIAAAVTEHAEAGESVDGQMAFTKDLSAIVVEEPELDHAEIPMVGPEYNTGELQQELAKSMHEILSGIVKPRQEEEIPEEILKTDEDVQEELHAPVEEEPLKGQLSIDDVLTSMVAGNTEAAVEEKPVAIVEEVAEEVAEEAKGSNVVSDATIDLSKVVERATMEAAELDFEQVRNTPPVNQHMFYRPAPELNPSEQPKLQERQKDMLGFFAHVKGLDIQLANSLGEIRQFRPNDRTSKSGNVVLTGNAGSGRTTLAISLAKILSKEKGQKSARVAKIYAEDLNKKDIASTVIKIAGGVLIIEEAGDLDDNAVDLLTKAMEFKTDGLLVILEDEKRYVKDLLARHPRFAEKFQVNIGIPVLTNDELVSFGKKYAYDKDYSIDDVATLALYNRIGALQAPERPVTLADVKDIVGNAIKHVERFGPRKLFFSLSGKRYDNEDRIILSEKDFK